MDLEGKHWGGKLIGTKRRIEALILLVTTLFLVSSGSLAHAFWGYPKSKKDCTSQYVATAKARLAASIYSRACTYLFNDRSLDMYVLELVRKSSGAYYDQEPSEDLTRAVHQKWYKEHSYAEFIQLIEKDYSDSRSREVAEAKCILDIDGLGSTETDVGASALLRESGCSKR